MRQAHLGGVTGGHQLDCARIIILYAVLAALVLAQPCVYVCRWRRLYVFAMSGMRLQTVKHWLISLGNGWATRRHPGSLRACTL